jgi:hypothetical protein
MIALLWLISAAAQTSLVVTFGHELNAAAAVLAFGVFIATLHGS